ncbi:MAG: tRNA guanosine(34) transglycosylase Tgt [Chloroflexi bacterium]|nr:tRNA guanosine(34) transglycosylase Tgt [Chloroflexota bacterium]
MRRAVRWSLQARCRTTAARAGILQTPHGGVPTPVFMPVGTFATVRTVDPDELRATGARLILANAYHLSNQPGAETVQALGGLHRLMGWDGPILTDSGGYQVFSLAAQRTIADDGVTFAGPDGAIRRLTPEAVVAVQEMLGADIAMPLDECCGYPVSRDEARQALARTNGWLHRSVEAQRRPDQAIFGIVHGSVYPDLRRQAVEAVVALDLPGYAIGGLMVGEPRVATLAILDATVPLLPVDRPRYVMGVGTPEDLLAAVALGVDLFDCVLPTRLARHGAFYSGTGRHQIRRAQFRRLDAPLDAACDCVTCRRFAAGYVAHLIHAGEELGLRLLTLHNVRFLVRLMEQARAAIVEGRFENQNQG